MGIADKMKSLIKENAVLILFTGIILPIITFMIEKAFFPEVIDHIVRRLPLNINDLLPTIIHLVVGTFIEELIYRQILQYIIAKFAKAPIAIVISSVLFALMHRTPGSLKIISIDLSGIFVDSILYGVIFNRSNILFSWTSHCMSDLTALFILRNFL